MASARHCHRSPLAFVGLWEVWDDAEDEPLRTCVIITTDANKLLAPIHDRVPVVLPPTVWDAWLDPSNEGVDRLQKLLLRALGREFEAYEITTRVKTSGMKSPS
jgi:putative SOS response-associated peptidase YedK